MALVYVKHHNETVYNLIQEEIDPSQIEKEPYVSPYAQKVRKEVKERKEGEWKTMGRPDNAPPLSPRDSKRRGAISSAERPRRGRRCLCPVRKPPVPRCPRREDPKSKLKKALEAAEMKNAVDDLCLCKDEECLEDQEKVTSPKGLSPKGLSPKGLSPKGLSPRGLSPKGLSPKELSPKRQEPKEHTKEKHAEKLVCECPECPDDKASGEKKEVQKKEPERMTGGDGDKCQCLEIEEQERRDMKPKKKTKPAERPLLPRHPKILPVDTRWGDKNPWIPSPTFERLFNKQKYGEVPKYIIQFKQEADEIRRLAEERRKIEMTPPIRCLTEEEREALIKGLKASWQELQKDYMLLPVITDTAAKKLRKTRMETELAAIEKDIKTLEKHPYIFVDREPVQDEE